MDTDLKRKLQLHVSVCCFDDKKFKSYIFSLSDLTMLINVKVIRMASQIKIGGFYFSQKQSANSSANCQFVKVERIRGKMEVVKHLMFDNCFMTEMLNNCQ